MEVEFANLLDQQEVNNLIRRLRRYRTSVGRECTNDDILVLISWARAIRRANVLFNLLLQSDYMLEVNIDKQEVYKVE
jgi:hypothetical protein